MKRAFSYISTSGVVTLAVVVGIWWFARPSLQSSKGNATGADGNGDDEEGLLVAVPLGTPGSVVTNSSIPTNQPTSQLYTHSPLVTPSTPTPTPATMDVADPPKWIAQWQQRRSNNAISGQMQDVAQAEATIADAGRSLRVGMTVAEVIDVMGPPHAILLWMPADENGVEDLLVGNLEEALRSPEKVWQLIYTPFPKEVANSKWLACNASSRMPSGPYRRFILQFGRFGDEPPGTLLHWTRPFEDELSP